MQFIMIEERAWQDVRSGVQKLCERVGQYAQKLTGAKPEDWLDAKDVCVILGLSPRTLHHYRNSGIIPHSRIGGKVYYHAGTVRKLLESGTVKPKQVRQWRT